MNYAFGYTNREKQLLRGWAEWLDTISWSAFCTFTTHHRLSRNAARKKMEKMTAYLQNKYSSSLRIFWVAEPHSCKDDYHVHALIKIDEPRVPVKESLTKAWHNVCPPAGYKQHNLVDVQDYEPSRGAHCYLAKHLQKDCVDYDMY